SRGYTTPDFAIAQSPDRFTFTGSRAARAGKIRAPVAQLDRALASEAKGSGFDPRRVQTLIFPQTGFNTGFADEPPAPAAQAKALLLRIHAQLPTAVIAELTPSRESVVREAGNRRELRVVQ